MPASNPRLTLTLTPESAAMLRFISELSGNSQSAIAAGLIETALPVLQRMAQVLQAAQVVSEESKVELRESLQRAQVRLEDQLGLVLETMDEGTRPLLQQAESIARRKARAPSRRATLERDGKAQAPDSGRSTPVPVTRGSGPPEGPTGRVRRGRV